MEHNMDDVVETLIRAKERGRKCTLLIGAGCSVTAGIPTAKGFVEIIEKDYTRAFKRARTKTYAHCMAELSLGERRDFIAGYVDKARINWAHIAIAQLMKAGFVDRVLTTNFDLLVVRACALLGRFLRFMILRHLNSSRRPISPIRPFSTCMASARALS